MLLLLELRSNVIHSHQVLLLAAAERQVGDDAVREWNLWLVIVLLQAMC